MKTQERRRPRLRFTQETDWRYLSTRVIGRLIMPPDPIQITAVVGVELSPVVALKVYAPWVRDIEPMDGPPSATTLLRPKP